jgi:hypothetical protein
MLVEGCVWSFLVGTVGVAEGLHGHVQVGGGTGATGWRGEGE